MNDITLPLWIFAVSVGVPCLSFLLLLSFIMRKIRKPNKEMIDKLQGRQTEDRQLSGGQFHSDLLSMQIDAVFNGLNAIIDTERIKIRTLLKNNGVMGLEMDNRPPDVPPARKNPPSDITRSEKPTLEQQIATFADSGDEADMIADELGLSQAEVDLALKMRSSRDSIQSGKWRAVA